MAALEYTSSPMATMVTVITLVLTGQILTPANVFMLLAFVNQLQVILSLNLSYGLQGTYDAYASLGRLEDFLLLENLPSIIRDQAPADDKSDIDGNTSLETNSQEEMQDPSVHDEVKAVHKPGTLLVRNLAHRQIKREDQFILQDVEVIADSGSLTVITGPVGSGKSTLLAAIAGEVSDRGGTRVCEGSLVYVPQIAWVFSGTIRENILFGESYDEAKYINIIEACALTEDIQEFPDRDQTVVGERGEVLSGGQRARVSLARAVYADADIYLLDDPLSAVDFKVGQHIFEKCIKGLLGDKTRVITSHQEQLMNEADTVMVLYKGRVLGKGSFRELEEKGILNTTVDPLLKKLNEDKSDSSFNREGEENGEVSDSRAGIVLQTNEAKGLQISEEDRLIGMVTSKLYWDYFRSGAPLLVIFAVISWCVITQGKPQQICPISKMSF